MIYFNPIFCALAAKYNLFIYQMYILAAYLHGDIAEEIYVKPPKELMQRRRKSLSTN